MSASETNGIPGNLMIPPGRDPHNLASKRSSSVLARTNIHYIWRTNLFLLPRTFFISAGRVSSLYMIRFLDQAVAYQHFY